MHGIGDLTVFAGPNASGKTNVIEALQLLTALSSFRNPKAAELIRQGEAGAKASIHMTDGKRELDLELVVGLGDDGSSPSRHYVFNGKKRPSKELRGMLPSVTFTPDDLNLAKGSNRFRRQELDLLGAQLNANYYQLVRDYEKIRRQKSKLLADDAPMDLIEAVDVVFEKVGNQLTNYRRSLFERIFPKVKDYYESFATQPERLDGTYLEAQDERSQFNRHTLADEAMAHRVLEGPHLHSINFFISGLPVQDYASQGQQRSLVLAMKLAEADLIEDILDQLPVLLLDDVMSELDGERRQALVKKLLEGKQAFITTANIDYFEPEMREKANVVTFDNRKNQ